MAHLSHKLRWADLDIDNETSREHFARVFVATLREFHDTTKDEPNLFVDGWGHLPNDPEHRACTTLYERQSVAGIVTSLLRNYIELNLALCGVHELPVTYTGVEPDIYPKHVHEALNELLTLKIGKPSWHGYMRWRIFDKHQTELAHEYLKMVFRLLYRNLNYYTDTIEREITSVVWSIAYQRKTQRERDLRLAHRN